MLKFRYFGILGFIFRWLIFCILVPKTLFYRLQYFVTLRVKVSDMLLQHTAPASNSSTPLQNAAPARCSSTPLQHAAPERRSNLSP